MTEILGYPVSLFTINIKGIWYERLLFSSSNKTLRFSCLPKNDYEQYNNVSRYFWYFFLDRKRSRAGRNALATKRGIRENSAGVCRLWRMSAIRAASTRWFSAIYSRRSAPANLSVVKCAQDPTNYRLARGHARRLPRARTLALRPLVEVSADRYWNILGTYLLRFEREANRTS